MSGVNRIQQNLLATAERRLLNWLCARLPAAVTPDMLTVLGFCGALTIFAGYALSLYSIEWLWLAIGGYFINWFGDSLDGSLARYRKIERPNYGYFIDHSMDALANLVIVIGLGLTAFIRMDAAMFALGAYLLLSIHTFLAARVTAEFRLSYLAAGPTELRLILIAMSIAMFSVSPKALWGTGLSAFDLFICGLGAGMLLLFVVQTTVTGRRLHALSK
jgi:archaetidylinositol phosphate synthase